MLIADFDNRANDPSFNGALENALGLGIEGASFVNAFDRGDAQKLAEQYKPGGRVDEQVARLISVREGISLIVRDRSSRRAPDICCRPAHRHGPLLDGPEPAARVLTAKAASKADVLRAVASLAAQVRTTLGDTTPAPQRRAEDETFTAASLDAIRSYAQAQDFANNDKDEQAGRTTAGRSSRIRISGARTRGCVEHRAPGGRREESAEHWKKALALLDRMTEREKYPYARGLLPHGRPQQ